METNINSRDCAFDIVRALCAIEIVAFWHLGNYLPVDYQYSPNVLHWGELITWGSLATFTFMSGFFLSKYSFTNRKSIWTFYKKRIIRFYFFYVAAVLTLWVGGLIVGESFFYDSRQLLLTLLGMGEFLYPYPPTVWYFCMLVFFYLLTPLIGAQNTITKKIIISIILFASLCLIKFFNILSIDERLLMYFPFYFIGLIMSKWVVSVFKIWWVGLVSFLIWLTVCVFFKQFDILGAIVVDSLFIIFIIAVGDFLTRNKGISTFFSYISYSSMLAYLFHSHFYLLAVFLVNYGSIGSMREATLTLWSVPIVIFLIFTISYFVQMIYDSIINRLQLQAQK